MNPPWYTSNGKHQPPHVGAAQVSPQAPEEAPEWGLKAREIAHLQGGPKVTSYTLPETVRTWKQAFTIGNYIFQPSILQGLR